MKAVSLVAIIVLVAIGLDVATKAWAQRALMYLEPEPVLGDVVQWTLGYNTGVAFGLMQGGGLLVFAASGLIILAVALWLVSRLRSGTPPATVWPASFILGGALANFVDRLPDGRVTDFIDAGLGAARWPAFNLADSFISVGMIALVLLTVSARPGSSSVESRSAA